MIWGLPLSSGVVSAEIIAIQQVDVAVFPAGDGEMWISTGLIGQQQHAGRSQIEILLRHLCLAVWGKEIDKVQPVAPAATSQRCR